MVIFGNTYISVFYKFLFQYIYNHFFNLFFYGNYLFPKYSGVKIRNQKKSNKTINKFLFYLIFLLSSMILMLLIFFKIFFAKSLIFPFALHPFDICNKYPEIWDLIKKIYILTHIISSMLIAKIIYNRFFNIKNTNCLEIKEDNINSKFKILIGKNNEKKDIYIEENGLYQNILVTGTIGSGKTSSALYPITKQLIEYKANIQKEKMAMLILDVKGNYYKQVLKIAKQAGRIKDIVIVELDGKYKYNPLDKINLNPQVLANRLKQILELFSPNNTESYWLDKAEQILAEAIKFCRLYNNGYVDFKQIHNLIMQNDYYKEKISIVNEKFKKGILNQKQVYELLSCINFLEKEFFCLDDRTISILKSEISRITNVFISDYNISKTFCPTKEECNFRGFKDCLENGKIVIFKMNIAEYKNLSKIIAAYLKIDFQSEVMQRLNKNRNIRKSCFICDEYHEYVTSNDADFFATSREAKCINLVATQSYTSILNTIKKEETVKVIIQNLINKLWFRTDDIFTIEEAQKQIGKEDKEKISLTISENAKETKFNYIKNTLISKDSNVSESYNKYTQNDYIFDTKFFSQELETFEALAFISNGQKIKKPEKIKLIPYFIKNGKENLNEK